MLPPQWLRGIERHPPHTHVTCALRRVRDAPGPCMSLPCYNAGLHATMLGGFETFWFAAVSTLCSLTCAICFAPCDGSPPENHSDDHSIRVWQSARHSAIRLCIVSHAISGGEQFLTATKIACSNENTPALERAIVCCRQKRRCNARLVLQYGT